MKRLRPLSIISVIGLAASLTAIAFADRLEYPQHYLTIAPTFHVTVSGDWTSARLVFFNDARLGPYTGGIIAVTGPDSRGGPKTIAFECPGIYYRHFILSNSTVMWTLSISLIYPLTISSIVPILRCFRQPSRRIGMPVIRSPADRK